ncbi:hypothetical protein [Halioxenophilus sp. WMMB6]|uniref:hypothetical protein n=1 Tax=Halioxenophilus sp. WMMB6 TaxID=3073815 RepID=UPI00295E2792|nr:hypothetical protein [Halioxenophilus sp. WMMB6]
MPLNNIYDFTMSDEEFDSVINNIQTVVEQLAPHVVSLTAQSRLELPKLGERTVAFVDKSYEYGRNHAELVPQFLDFQALDRDMRAVRMLGELTRLLRPLLDNVDDSLTLAGSEAYQAALVFYRSVKVAAQSQVPNAKSIADDLSVRFPGRGRGANTAVDTPVATLEATE